MLLENEKPPKSSPGNMDYTGTRLIFVISPLKDPSIIVGLALKVVTA
jgi:hypothetical protein